MLIANSPHNHGGDSVRKNMLRVILALMPAYIASIYYFGLGALAVSLISIASCVFFEFIIAKYLMKQEPTITDCSAILTGLLLALNVPTNLPWWIMIIGAAVAIGIGKMAFGGLGSNPFNPALVGRVFLLISFPAQMTTWPVPEHLSTHYMDAETGATPLSLIKSLANTELDSSSSATVLKGIEEMIASLPDYLQLLYGNTGGMLLGAIFMATDYATSPMTHAGQIIYGIGIGVITVVIRLWGSYPEGMSFAILIMNAVTPLINKYVRPKPFSKL